MREDHRQINFNEYAVATAKTLESQIGIRMQAVVKDETWPQTDDLIEHTDWADKLEEPFAGKYTREQVKRALSRFHFEWQLDTDDKMLMENSKREEELKTLPEQKVPIDSRFAGRIGVYDYDYARIVKTARAAGKEVPRPEELIKLPDSSKDPEGRKKAIEELLGVPLIEPPKPEQPGPTDQCDGAEPTADAPAT